MRLRQAERGVIGLHNIGYSCYINSGLQCLLHTKTLVDFFTSHPPSCFENDERLELLRLVSWIFIEAWDKGTRMLNLSVFKKGLTRIYPQFKEGQQDCQEFLALLLDTLQDQIRLWMKDQDGTLNKFSAQGVYPNSNGVELRKKRKFPTQANEPFIPLRRIRMPSPDITDFGRLATVENRVQNGARLQGVNETKLLEAQSALRSDSGVIESTGDISNFRGKFNGNGDFIGAEKFWGYLRSKNDNIIGGTFQGILNSVIVCETCEHEASMYEPFMHLSVGIPSSSPTAVVPPRSCSIYECLNAFFKFERLDKENLWACSNCKKNRRAKKGLQICTFPDVLIISLNRYYMCGKVSKKAKSAVRFPVTDLNLSPYAKKGVGNEGDYQYNLYGVVCHTGETLNRGHYTAYARNSDGEDWKFFNDGLITSGKRPDESSYSSAYLLFYIKTAKKRNDLETATAREQMDESKPRRETSEFVLPKEDGKVKAADEKRSSTNESPEIPPKEKIQTGVDRSCVKDENDIIITREKKRDESSCSSAHLFPNTKTAGKTNDPKAPKGKANMNGSKSKRVIPDDLLLPKKERKFERREEFEEEKKVAYHLRRTAQAYSQNATKEEILADFDDL